MSARSGWNIFVLQSGNTWLADSTVSRPNDNFTTLKNSTKTKFRLADGDVAFVNPSVKKLEEPVNFVWYDDVDGTIKDKISGYINNSDDLKITDDIGNTFYGSFISISAVRISGLAEETYDLQAVLEINNNLPS